MRESQNVSAADVGVRDLRNAHGIGPVVALLSVEAVLKTGLHLTPVSNPLHS
jgi:hypothetical protein